MLIFNTGKGFFQQYPFILPMNGLKKKIFITPPVAAKQIIFAGVHRPGSNCYSTTTVDRVALILGCPFPAKGDEFIIFS